MKVSARDAFRYLAAATGTIREMALVWSHYFMDWSGGEDAGCNIQIWTGTAADSRPRAATCLWLCRTSRRAVGRGAVAESRGRQACPMDSFRRSQWHLRRRHGQDVSAAWRKSQRGLLEMHRRPQERALARNFIHQRHETRRAEI